MCFVCGISGLSSAASIPNKPQKLKYLTTLPVMFTFRSSATSPPPAVNMSTHCEAHKETKGAWLYSNSSSTCEPAELQRGVAAARQLSLSNPRLLLASCQARRAVSCDPCLPHPRGCVPRGISHHLVTSRPGRSSSSSMPLHLFEMFLFQVFYFISWHSCQKPPYL